MTKKITRSEMLAEEMTRFCLDHILAGEAYRLSEIDFRSSRFAFGETQRKIRVQGHVETTKGEGTFQGEMTMSHSEAIHSWQPTILDINLDSPTIRGCTRFVCGYDDPKSVDRKLVIKLPALSAI